MQFMIWVLATLHLIRLGLVEYNVKPSLENLKPTASPGNVLFDRPGQVYAATGALFVATFERHIDFIRRLTKHDVLVIGTVGKYTTHFNLYLVHDNRNTLRSRTVYDPLALKRGEFRWLYRKPDEQPGEWHTVGLDNGRLQYDRTNPLMSFELQHSPKLHDYFEGRRVGFY